MFQIETWKKSKHFVMWFLRDKMFHYEIYTLQRTLIQVYRQSVHRKSQFKNNWRYHVFIISLRKLPWKNETTRVSLDRGTGRQFQTFLSWRRRIRWGGDEQRISEEPPKACLIYTSTCCPAKNIYFEWRSQEDLFRVWTSKGRKMTLELHLKS